MGGCPPVQAPPTADAPMPRAAATMPAPPPGCVAELRNLGRRELNGFRGVCLPQTDELRAASRVGVRLDDGRELSVGAGKAAPVIAMEAMRGKGLGVQAALPMKAGDLIVREQPVLSGTLGERPDRTQFKELSSYEQQAVMSLCDVYACGPGDRTLEGIMLSNALPRGPRSEETVLCLLASRFNHSCAPNAEYLWLDGQGVEEVRAVREINPGEEVTVNYLGDTIRHPSAARQAQLREGFRFDCRCAVCEAADPESDLRRERLLRLSDEILDCRDRPEAGLSIAEEMLELMEQEGVGGPRTAAQVCNDGVELSLLTGDTSEVQYWAHMSYEAHRMGWGEDDPMTKKMKHYTQHPPQLAPRDAGAGSTAASSKRDRSGSPSRRRAAESAQVRTCAAAPAATTGLPGENHDCQARTCAAAPAATTGADNTANWLSSLD